MKREYRFWVYIMGSRSLNFYIGLTNNLRKRAWQHKRGEVKGFTQRYRIDRLLYFEEFVYFDRAESRETELKKWRREKKIELIKTMNPTFLDLAEHWYDDLPEGMQIPRRSAPRNDNSKSSRPMIRDTDTELKLNTNSTLPAAPPTAFSRARSTARSWA